MGLEVENFSLIENQAWEMDCSRLDVCVSYRMKGGVLVETHAEYCFGGASEEAGNVQ